MNDLLRPDYGMLEYFEETRTFWFNPNTLEAQPLPLPFPSLAKRSRKPR